MTPNPHPEERHARALHRRLSDELARSVPGTTVAVNGAGVHWDCSASRGARACEVSCFDVGPAEYLATLSDAGRPSAIGRTRSADDVAGAVGAWLAGQGLPDLYARFDFIDGYLRALRRIEAEALGRFPNLAGGTSREVRQILCDSYELLFRAQDRSCCVSYYGDNERPDAAFRWDDCELFVVPATDAETLAPLLSRWLCERVMPSALQAEFPWLKVDPVAKHYEAGNPVEGEFLTSWDDVVRFYEDVKQPLARDALAFLARLRESGFDRTLRAGQSMFTLVVSRSRRHGLRHEQASIAFDFRPGQIAVCACLDGERETLAVAGVHLPPELIELLERLESKPVD
jgi:hypothetical protein